MKHVHGSLSVALLTASVSVAAACESAADHAARARPDNSSQLELALSGGDRAPATFVDTLAPGPRTVSPILGTSRKPPTITRVLPFGSTLRLRLDQSLSTTANLPGDEFTATLESDVADADGAVVLPAGASVRGRVTRVQESGRAGETAVLSLAFEAVSFGERSYPLVGSVISANPERAPSPAPAGADSDPAAVAVIGRVIDPDTISAAAGAKPGVAGTAIAMGTADVEAVLRAGSLMVIRTEAPVAVTVELKWPH